MQSLGKVLLIEDESITRALFAEALEQRGFTVVLAEDGLEGLDRLAEEKGIDAIILDMMLPGMNGWEFRIAQWHMVESARIPLVIVSAIVTLQQTAKLLEASACFSKPVDLDKLAATLEKLCARTTGRSESASAPRADTTPAEPVTPQPADGPGPMEPSIAPARPETAPGTMGYAMRLLGDDTE